MRWDPHDGWWWAEIYVQNIEDDALNVVGHLEGEVAVHQGVHLRRREGHQTAMAISSSWMPSGSVNVSSVKRVPAMG